MYGRESDSEDSQEEGGEGLDNPAFYPSKGAGGPPGSESWCWQGLRFWGRPRPFWTAPGGPPDALNSRQPSFALPGPSAACYEPHSSYGPILAANKRPPGLFSWGLWNPVKFCETPQWWNCDSVWWWWDQSFGQCTHTHCLYRTRRTWKIAFYKNHSFVLQNSNQERVLILVLFHHMVKFQGNSKKRREVEEWVTIFNLLISYKYEDLQKPQTYGLKTSILGLYYFVPALLLSTDMCSAFCI